MKPIPWDHIEPGVRVLVRILVEQAGVTTFSSCEGGPGHTYPCRMVRFRGDAFRAVRVARAHGFPLLQLSRHHSLTGALAPFWQLLVAQEVPEQASDSF
jgi:hypothetical protein